MSDYRIEAATKEEWAIRAMNAETKLAKAVEYLRKIAAYTHIGTHDQGIVQNAEARIARAVLAHLEGGE
jgi:hypothetical protein